LPTADNRLFGPAGLSKFASNSAEAATMLREGGNRQNALSLKLLKQVRNIRPGCLSSPISIYRAINVIYTRKPDKFENFLAAKLFAP
jgi:hypothetical protein